MVSIPACRAEHLGSVPILSTFYFDLRGVQASKFQNHDSEILVDPKGPPGGSTFWLGFGPPDPYVRAWDHAHFCAQIWPQKPKMTNKVQK